MKVEVEIGEIKKETLSNDIMDAGLRIVEIMNTPQDNDGEPETALDLLQELAYNCLRVIELYKLRK